MGNRFITLLVVAVSLLVASVPVMAHHGDASFGSGDPVTVKGTVVEWLWSNPHCLLRFDVKGDDGQVQHWIGETQSPSPSRIKAGMDSCLSLGIKSPSRYERSRTASSSASPGSCSPMAGFLGCWQMNHARGCSACLLAHF